MNPQLRADFIVLSIGYNKKNLKLRYLFVKFFLLFWRNIAEPTSGIIDYEPWDGINVRLNRKWST